jgi:hypothetical protein
MKEKGKEAFFFFCYWFYTSLLCLVSGGGLGFSMYCAIGKSKGDMALGSKFQQGCCKGRYDSLRDLRS